MNKFFNLSISAILIILLLSLSNFAVANSASKGEQQKAVLVTGASSGIGLKIAQTLASKGYFVYAGARKQKDLDMLNKITNVQSIRLDVTKQNEIDAAVITVKNGGKGLYGLINNAGVFIGGPLVEVSTEETRWLLDVNVLGPYRITKAFAPMIIAAKGRISTIGSIAGTLAGTFMGRYSMSKHAFEAYTDSLSAEMARFGVKVSVIEPGNYRSKIIGSAALRMTEKEYAQPGSAYAEDMQKMIAGMNSKPDRSQYKDPDDVADAALHAMFDTNPKLRYMVVPNQEEADLTVGKAMKKMVQLNADQPYAYSREQLIELLDQAMSSP